MSIGFACILLAVPGSSLRTCTLKTANREKLEEIIRHNLEALDSMVDYIASHNINMFRISSDIIPFGSHPINEISWWLDFADKLSAIGEKLRHHGIRVSMHPGQYTVINSPDEGVVARAFDDLIYHDRFMSALGMDGTNKIILHVGGVYGDKPASVERFIRNYRRLPQEIKARLVIENDERCFNIKEVLEIGLSEGIPVVFDNLHHAIHPPVITAINSKETGSTDSQGPVNIDLQELSSIDSQGPVSIDLQETGITDSQGPVNIDLQETGIDSREPDIVNSYNATPQEWIGRCSITWKASDGRQKTHYSQQAANGKPGAHSTTIALPRFLEYYNAIHGEKPDIMLEVKDKNISAIKCNLAIREDLPLKELEGEWARYKYLVLSHSQPHYLAIRALFRNAGERVDCNMVEDFYRLIEESLNIEPKKGDMLNAAHHIWGYFKEQAAPAEKNRFIRLIGDFENGGNFEPVKNHLLKLAEKYDSRFLLECYFFA